MYSNPLAAVAREHLQEWDKIWTINKRIIDPVCPRHTAVVAAGRVPVTITGTLMSHTDKLWP